MKQYGKTFQYIRKNKNLSQEVVAHHIMSRSNLSRFEQGSYAVSYFIFIQLLQRLDMLYEEFLYIHNHYQRSKIEQLYTSLVLSETKSDKIFPNTRNKSLQGETSNTNDFFSLPKQPSIKKKNPQN